MFETSDFVAIYKVRYLGKALAVRGTRKLVDATVEQKIA